jgi:hypothetical protein
MRHEDLIISLMEARKKGKTIQWCCNKRDWYDMESDDFEFATHYDYRIKPNEPREFLLAKNKLATDSVSSYWIVSNGEEYVDGRDVDYIRVREILED